MNNARTRKTVRGGIVGRTAAAKVGPPLARDAVRLLGALSERGAWAGPDPLAEAGEAKTSTDLRVCRGGAISLAGPRFARAAADALVAADLAAWEGADRPGGDRRLRITDAGRARLRRTTAAGDTAYLAQHLDLTRRAGPEPGDGLDGALHDASESPLAWMARRRDRDGRPLLDAAGFEAGERLRRDIALAAMLPRTGADFGAPRVDGGGARDPASAADAVIAARQRVRAALAATGSDLSGLLIDLCGFLKGLERIEAERRWPARSAKVVARIALGRLAEHYGYEREATGPDRARTRLWREG